MSHIQPDWNATSGSEGEILNKPTVVTNPMTADLNMGSHTVTGLSSPNNPTDAVTLAYVQAFVAGLSWKTAVRVASDTALTGTYNNGSSGVGATFTLTATGVLTIDGVAVTLNDRVLLKDQVSTFQNGIYSVTTAGAIGVAAILTRTTDADNGSELVSAAVSTGTEGSANGGKAFNQTTAAPITIGTTALLWNKFLDNVYTEGTGIRIASNTIYNKLSEGVTGGQTAIGGTAADDTFTLQGSSSTSPRTTNAPAIKFNSGGVLGGGAGAAQIFAQLLATINASSTAGYTLFKLAATETSVGSGVKKLFELLAGAAGTSSRFSVSNTGAVTQAGPLNLQGSTSGAITIQVGATTATFSLTLPTTAPNAGQAMVFDASGNGSWQTLSVSNNLWLYYNFI